mmetsp:Transcript_38972/g.111531  ORF Transcript_38972/g.111531 Transcript_38972/m.111531 type:complete len:213 (-) Transcript_38972:499-1137(-)
MLLLLLARLRGQRVHLRDGLPQHFLVLRLAGPEGRDLLVQVVPLPYERVTAALHLGGELVHEVPEPAPLQRHGVVEEAAVHRQGRPALLPLRLRGGAPRHGGRRRRLAAASAAQALLEQGGRRGGILGGASAEGVQQRTLDTGRRLQPGRDLRIARAQGRAPRSVAHLPLDEVVAAALFARAPGHVQDRVEDGLVALPEAQLVRVLGPGGLV